MRRLILLVIAGLMIAAPSGAQGILAGAWEGETNAGAAVLLELTVKGTTLTGTLTRNGLSTPLSDGQMSKNAFTFKAKLNERLEGFSGERAGDQLKVWLDRQGRETAIVLKRVKRSAPNR